MKQPTMTNYFMLIIMLLSSIMMISSTNMLMAWFSLELNLFSFTPILLNKMTMNETEASMNYFLAQALGSSMFLMSSMFLTSTPWITKINITMIISSILLKMGAAPCHFWYPMTMELSSWFNCLLLSSWQKLAPMIMLMFMLLPKLKMFMMLMVASMNSITGGIMGLSQSSTKKIMAYSSITHMGWMLSSSIIYMPCLSMAYLISYSIIISPLFIMFNKTNTTKINHLWSNQKMPYKMITTMSIMLLSLGGLPPLTGFIPKFIIMKMMMNTSSMLLMMLIMGSLMNLFFYINISLNMLMSMKKNKDYPMTYQNSTITTLSLNFLAFLIMML